MFFVYVLRSAVDGKLYTGFTTNILQRLSDHNAGRVPSTRDRIPLQMIFYEAYSNKDDALRREKYLKTTAGKKAIKFMLSTTLKKNSSLS